MSLDASDATGAASVKTGSNEGGSGGTPVGLRIPPIYTAASFGLSPLALDNGPAFNTAIATLRARKGGILLLDVGNYKVRTGSGPGNGIYDNYSTPDAKIQIWGDGVYGTAISADGPLLTTGDLITLDKSVGIHFQDIDFSATGARANPCRCVVINGLFTAPVSSLFLQDIHFRRCNMTHQFDGCVLNDSPGGLGVQGMAWDDCLVTNTTTGGNAFDVATQNGELIRFSNILHTENPARTGGVSRPNSTFRIRAVDDLRMIGVENVYCDHGLLVQPGFGLGAGTWNVNTVWMERCIFGQDYFSAVEIDGSTGGVGLVKIHDMYVDGIDGTHLGFYAHGAGIKGLQCTDLTALACAEAIRLDAVTGQCRFSANVADSPVGLHATGSTTNFDVGLNFTNFIGGNGTGALIDAGCAHFNLRISGQVNCTTPLTDSSGAVVKNIINT